MFVIEKGTRFCYAKRILCLSLKRRPESVMLKGYYVCHWKGISVSLFMMKYSQYVFVTGHVSTLQIYCSSYCVDVVIRQAKASSQCMLWRYMQAVPMTYISVKKTLTTLDNIRIITCYRKEKQIQAVPITAMVSIHF